MTTTSEKIKALEARLELLRQDLKNKQEDIDALELDIANIACEDIKPADPEPLECWVNVYQKPRKCTFWRSEKEADDYADVGRLRKACLREATPQDEQDRKDAERYRFLKETKQGRDLLMPAYREKWDEMIDHAMVDEMIDKALEQP